MTLSIIESPKSKEPLSFKQGITISTISLVVGFIIFIIAYVGMKGNQGVGVFNQPLLSWILNNRNPQITNVAQIITSIASPLIFASIVLGVATIWAIAKKELWRPSLLIISVTIAAIVSTLLKAITMDSRPAQINMIPAFETNFSFPSGHTISMIVFMLVFGYVIYSRNYSPARFWGWAFAALFGTGLIAATRLYLGYHWLTDVVASIGLGFIILAFIIIADIIFIRRSNK